MRRGRSRTRLHTLLQDSRSVGADATVFSFNCKARSFPFHSLCRNQSQKKWPDSLLVRLSQQTAHPRVYLFVFPVIAQDSTPSAFSSGDVLIPLADEYDPMFPNDYEKVVKRHREERQRQREQERQKEIDEREKYEQRH